MSTKVVGFAAVLVSLSLCVPVAQARDTTHYFSVKNVIEMGKARGDLGNDVSFYFAGQPHPPVQATLVRGITTNKKTHSGGKGDHEACNWALLTALIQMQQGARRHGGNAVVNIESFYKRSTYRSGSQYECHAGNIMAGVALRGDVVRLRR